MDTFTVSHENALLREPWPSQQIMPNGENIYARACIFGEHCMGMSQDLPGHNECGGVVLAEAMTPSELREFEETGNTPATRRACILCNRYVTMEAYLFVNKTRACAQNCLFNWYVNPIDCEDGYPSGMCLPLGTNERWSGIYGKVCMLSLNNLRIVQDNVTRRWYVHQDLAKASESMPTSPEEQVFCRGAA